MDVVWVLAGIAASAILVVLLIVTVPEVISRHMVRTRIRRVTEQLDGVTSSMGEFQVALAHMTETVTDFSRVMQESGLTQLTVEHHEKEIGNDRSN